MLFELFALDVLPVGAVRYPDYGPATVAATALASDSPWQFALGVSAALGLVLAVLGGFSPSAGAPRQRAGHPAPLRRRSPPGESGAIRRLQYGCAAARCRPGRGLTALGLACAWVLAEPVAALDRSTGAGAHPGRARAARCRRRSAARSAAPGAAPRLRWLGAGALVGLLAAALR